MVEELYQEQEQEQASYTEGGLDVTIGSDSVQADRLQDADSLQDAAAAVAAVVDQLKNVSDEDSTAFFRLVKELVARRNQYQKKTYYNELFKLVANSGIGQMGRGLAGKSVEDIDLKKRPIPSSELSSPVYAGWVTAYIRTTVSELLN